MLRREFFAAVPFVAQQAFDAQELIQSGNTKNIDPFAANIRHDDLVSLIARYGFEDQNEALARARKCVAKGWSDIGVWAKHGKVLTRSALVGTDPKTGMIDFLPPMEVAG